jgi:hypothetical protein
MVLKNAVFWDVTLCGSWKKGCFGGTDLPYHHDDKNRRARSYILETFKIDFPECGSHSRIPKPCFVMSCRLPVSPSYGYDTVCCRAGLRPEPSGLRIHINDKRHVGTDVYLWGGRIHLVWARSLSFSC